MGWPALKATPEGIQIAATCTIAELHDASLSAEWPAAPLVGQCCRALLASFKIWNMATVGGNICLGLPAGSMTSLLAALDGVGTIWMPDGNDRHLPIAELVTGPSQTALAPGEILRQIDVTTEALSRRTAFRQVSLTSHGRSGALLIGTLGPDGFALTVTASVPSPVQLRFPAVPPADELAASIASAIPPHAYFDDMHGAPEWRRHLTLHLAEEIRCELDR
jgi:CO/xanthine dehydrogenase FAD-binding subunit